jgi:hypothetical protein
MSTASMLARLRARRDAWSLFAWLCLGAALMLTVMPGDLAAVHALRMLVGLVALFVAAGASVLAVNVLRRDPRPRDVAMTGASLLAAIAIILVAF